MKTKTLWAQTPFTVLGNPFLAGPIKCDTSGKGSSLLFEKLWKVHSEQESPRSSSLNQLSHQPEFTESSPQKVVPTFCDDTFQVDDVGVVKLPHDACFSQEISSLFLCVAHLQGFDSHWKLTLSLQLQPPTADFPKFTFRGKSGRMGSHHVKGTHDVPLFTGCSTASADGKHEGLPCIHGYGLLNITVMTVSNSHCTTSQVIRKHKKTRSKNVIFLYLKSYALCSTGFFSQFVVLSTIWKSPVTSYSTVLCG